MNSPCSKASAWSSYLVHPGSARTRGIIRFNLVNKVPAMLRVNTAPGRYEQHTFYSDAVRKKHAILLILQAASGIWWRITCNYRFLTAGLSRCGTVCEKGFNISGRIV